VEGIVIKACGCEQKIVLTSTSAYTNAMTRLHSKGYVLQHSRKTRSIGASEVLNLNLCFFRRPVSWRFRSRGDCFRLQLQI
jgi:hypothetical protein